MERNDAELKNLRKENMNRAMVTDGKMLKAIYRQMMELGCI